MSTRQGSGRISSIDILQAIRCECNNLSPNEYSIKKLIIDNFPDLVEFIYKLIDLIQCLGS